MTPDQWVRRYVGCALSGICRDVAGNVFLKAGRAKARDVASNIHLLRRLRRQDVASGEGPARLSALSVLVFGGPKTLGELAAAEQVKPPTMSRIVAVLARSKLVTIHAETQDARRMHIRATAKGVKLLQEGRQRRIDYLASRLSGLTREELAQVAESTEILARVL
jgi:DNA-binding MarR family transcriptional regulator